MSQTRPEPDPGAPPDPRPPDPKPPDPDLLASLREVGSAAKATVKEAGGSVSAFRTLLAADFSLARSAFGRTLAFTGVAIVFGASAWLLLMAALIVFLSVQLGVPWSASLLGTAALSGLGAYLATRKGEFYFDHTRMHATRRQLARLGIGELAGLVPDADSSASARTTGPRADAVNKDGVEVTPE